MIDDDDRWFGVFQGYRPHGDGVDEVFASLEDSPNYAARVRSVCQAAFHPDWARDAYFVVRTPPLSNDTELIDFGKDLLAGLRLIAVLATLSGHRELHEYIGAVDGVVVVPSGECDRRNDDHALVQDSLGDILRGFYDYGHRTVHLREGFYSVACDYWLAWYLQWPYFQKWIPRDVFRPYFELWSRGCEVVFQGKSLCIARQAETQITKDAQDGGQF
ncbi:hypothetical protein [Zavarzinella formosa]|uniref:hypothetical protein n=1 Tax=Zavarzinella formosa TaxID=360055 RepID=UPI00035E370E|nr:hypothetical protein [Zavarzinella formosa]